MARRGKLIFIRICSFQVSIDGRFWIVPYRACHACKCRPPTTTALRPRSADPPKRCRAKSMRSVWFSCCWRAVDSVCSLLVRVKSLLRLCWPDASDVQYDVSNPLCVVLAPPRWRRKGRSLGCNVRVHIRVCERSTHCDYDHDVERCGKFSVCTPSHTQWAE